MLRGNIVKLLILIPILLLVGCEVTQEQIYCSECMGKCTGFGGGLYNKINVSELTNDYNYTHKCCYPYDCPQANNNPELCTCMYMVECYTEEEVELDNPHVTNQYSCEEGCIYAEWIVYGYRNLSKPAFYTECAEVCRVGDDYFNKTK